MTGVGSPDALSCVFMIGAVQLSPPRVPGAGTHRVLDGRKCRYIFSLSCERAGVPENLLQAPRAVPVGGSLRPRPHRQEGGWWRQRSTGSPRGLHSQLEPGPGRSGCSSGRRHECPRATPKGQVGAQPSHGASWARVGAWGLKWRQQEKLRADRAV